MKVYILTQWLEEGSGAIETEIKGLFKTLGSAIKEANKIHKKNKVEYPTGNKPKIIKTKKEYHINYCGEGYDIYGYNVRK